MAENILEDSIQDRVVDLMLSNRSAGQSLFGLTKAVVRMCAENGWDARRLSFRTPHLDGRGFMTISFTGVRRGRTGYREAWSSTSFAGFFGGMNYHVTRFFRSSPGWRQTVLAIYDRAVRYAHEGRQPFPSLSFSLARIHEPSRTAWIQIYRQDAARVEDEKKAAA